MLSMNDPGDRGRRTTLIELLRTKKEVLLERWMQRVLGDPSVPEANRLSEPMLLDHIPALLEQLTVTLAQRGRAAEHAEERGREIGQIGPAQAHARQRLRESYSLAEALRELSHLRAAVIDLCAAEGVDLAGEEALLVHSALDESMTTAAIASDERNLLIGRATNDAVWDWDIGTDRIRWNDALYTLFDYAPGQFRYDMQWWEDNVHPEERARVVQGIHAVVVGKGEAWADEYRFRRADGHYATVLDRGFVARDATGKATRMVGSMLDLTERKQAVMALTESLAREQHARADAERERGRAEAANRMKDEFLATVSHELRTPLTAILGWARMLKDEQLGEARLLKGLDTIERNARAQAQLIEDILDVSRIITGKIRISSHTVDVASVVEAALDTVRPAAEAKGVHLGASFEEGLGLIIGDQDRLQQVVWNLLLNAVKFTPRGGQVLVLARRCEGETVITVRDTGRGISPAFLPYVFDRFRQDDASTTRSHGGLGLGLAIVRHLVELHGGTVSADSPGEGQGATMSVRLPIRAAAPIVAEEAPRRLSSDPPSVRSQPLALGGLQLLAVDDESDARELIAMVLEHAGAKVTSAASASEAVRCLEELPFDALVSDIGMPGEDGYALMRRIRGAPSEATRGIPAIALTAYARIEDRRKALAAGFQAHVAKPIEPRELVEVIRRLLR